MKDTARMKAISNADLEKSGKSKKKKSSGFGVFINTFGMILLAIMLVIVGVNFTRDSRIMQKHNLSSNANTGDSGTKKEPASGNASDDNEKDKPAAKSTTKASSSSDKDKDTKSTETAAAVTPTITPEP